MQGGQNLRIRGFKGALLAALIVFAMIWSMIIIDLPTASAGGVISSPAGTTITVAPGQTFLLRHTMIFNNPASGGYLAMAIYWDASSANENFVLDNAINAYWTSGGSGAGNSVENLQWDNLQGGPGQWMVGVWIDSADKNYYDGTFNVDIWLRAASTDGTLHKPGNQQLSYGLGILLAEPSAMPLAYDNITINVLPCKGTASIRLATGSPPAPPFLWGIRKVRVTTNLVVYTGDNLHLIFLAYDNKTVESDNVIWSRTISGPENVVFTNRIVPHDNNLSWPAGGYPSIALAKPAGDVHRVKLVLTDSAGNIILDNMVWYTATKDDWGTRITWIILNWPSHTAAKQDQLGNEITPIILNWASTPTTRDQYDFQWV